MDVIGVGAASNAAEPNLLSFFHASVGGFQPIRGLAAHDRAGDVTKESALLRARKDVHDDGRVGADRSAALIVRIHTLIARSNDGMARNEAERHDGGIDDPL